MQKKNGASANLFLFKVAIEKVWSNNANHPLANMIHAVHCLPLAYVIKWSHTFQQEVMTAGNVPKSQAKAGRPALENPATFYFLLYWN